MASAFVIITFDEESEEHKAIELNIISPRRGIVYPANGNRRVRLQATVADQVEGRIPNKKIVWSSSIDGRLGSDSASGEKIFSRTARHSSPRR
mmetsp:Transcript_22679/g.43056  ORF Transcript_22679/g.43056 Transcript_22679/m.43056 type:complete len:93 (+) Transcript_22679:92-370(+)